MQSMWSRTAPSQSTCRCVSCLSTVANGVTSRSATAASKKKLRIGNSVTALYTSIFAAAALADAKAKTKRRHDLEEKIAAVKAEVNELVDEEQRILESLQSRRKHRGINRLLQERAFGTVTNPSRIRQRSTLSQPTRSFHTQRRLFNSQHAQMSETLPIEEDSTHLDLQEAEASELRAAMNEALPDWVVGDTARIKAIQKLALKKFAIRILLRPAIAHNYSGVPMNYGADFDVPQIDVKNLLQELNTVRRQMNTLLHKQNVNLRDVIDDFDVMRSEEAREEDRRLDDELRENIQSFMSQQMSLQELLLRISSNLIKSADPDRTTAFREMLMAFTQTRQNDLNDLLLQSLLPNRFYLSTSLIVTIVSFFRKSKNLKDFDLFLQMLSGEGYTVNLGAIGLFRRRKINGLNMVIPPLYGSSTVIYTELISAALRFNQPDRADAWLQAARKSGFFDNFNTLFTYLRFYSIRQDWEKGMNALKRAVTYLVSSTDLPPKLVERLILYMVHLCDSCCQKEVSESLISAAVHSGFSPDIPSQQNDIAPIVDPEGKRWKRAAETTPTGNLSRPLWQKCYDFANVFGQHLSSLEVPEDQSISQRFTRLAALHANDAMSTTLPHNRERTNFSKAVSEPAGATSSTAPTQNTQSEDIAALKDEVSQLRQLVFELRKHHIEASFKEDIHHDLEYEDALSQPSEPTPPSYNSASQPQDSPMSVEFERIPSPISCDASDNSPSNFAFRPAQAMMAPVQVQDHSAGASENQVQQAPGGQTKKSNRPRRKVKKDGPMPSQCAAGHA
ncbi:uncharacterized protein N7482_006968 [Penicillium canariense]|uniref:Uncharacterized protein n=1 Tax=Penicillium canariense TaxID=189055 RepID=A0A9W9LJP3_9EURO|nr:uncharacterized protein N7482_006968 [Penicillium canariense]KAJ5159964.1 hypothetical protein N7482_006968 [Penicillium canariense]